MAAEPLKADARYFLKLLRVNMKAAMALRAAYALRASFAIVTHIIYILVWFIFFQAVPGIGGWKLEHILLAYGLAMCAWGIVSFLAYGLRTLPAQIEGGELDAFLTQPRPVLLNVAMSSSKASGPGETIFGLALILYAGIITGVSLPALLLCIVCATLVFAAIVLATASLGFWLRNFHATAEEMYFNFNIMASRPGAVFSGWMQIMTLTVIPVAFMTHLPLDWLLGHQRQALAWMLGGTVLCCIAALLIFHFGLRYYESGNRFGVRG